MSPGRKKFLLFAVPGLAFLALDQWTKVLARASLAPRGYRNPVVVIDGYFDLRYSENTGVAFGMLQGVPGGRVVLAVVAAAAFFLVLHYLRQTQPGQSRLQLALGLVGGGAMGNLVDRIIFGTVSDFIVWKVGAHEWPAFNIADAALVVGVILMALDIFPQRPGGGPGGPPGGASQGRGPA